MVLFQKLVVYAGPVVEAFLVRQRHHLDEVLVASLVLYQQHQVVGLAVLVGILVVAAAPCDVALAAYDGLDAALFGFLVEAHRAEHDSVVRDGDGAHAELLYARHELVYAAGAVQEAVFSMYM